MNNYEIVWNLFKKTGDIKYYLMAKKLEGEVNAADKESRRDSNK